MIQTKFQTNTNGCNPLNHAMFEQVLFCYPCVNRRLDHPFTASWAEESTKIIPGRCTTGHKAPARTPEFSYERWCISFFEANRACTTLLCVTAVSNLWCIKYRSTMAINFWWPARTSTPRHRLALDSETKHTSLFSFFVFIIFKCYSTP